jgi:hypothetical protein
MKINWIIKQAGWAFENLCNHLVKKMPQHEHQLDGKNAANINFVCSPNFFKSGISGDEKTILHLDSNRWYEPFIEGKNDNK